MRIYRGERTPIGQRVTVREDGRVHVLRHEERHSPNGFDWGPRDRRVWGGGIRRRGGPDLALALLTDVCGRPAAERHYQDFARDVLEELPREQDWEMTEREIADWVAHRSAPTLTAYRR
jgi:hypothetical protein